jgi:hypothetical protein
MIIRRKRKEPNEEEPVYSNKKFPEELVPYFPMI